MLSKKLTPKLVREYHHDLLIHVGANAIYKCTFDVLLDNYGSFDKLDGIAGKVAELLKNLGVPDPKEFLATTAVTIPIGFGKIDRTVIYVPWDPGETDGGFSLSKQVGVLAHEAQHAIRANKDPKWLAQYLTSFTSRCEEERKAFQTSLEMHWLLYGRLPTLRGLTANADRYFLRPKDKEVLIAGLSAVIRPIEEGDRSTPIGKWAAQWFRDKGLM